MGPVGYWLHAGHWALAARCGHAGHWALGGSLPGGSLPGGTAWAVCRVPVPPTPRRMWRRTEKASVNAGFA
jgi:hypothetical protein